MDAILERFVAKAPVAVMARLGLEHALRADAVDALFATHAATQYTRELLFSTTVDLMALVALRLRPSLRAAARKADLPVSLTSVYNKVNGVEPRVVQALVRETAARLAAVAAPLRRPAPVWLRGYRIRVADGNHFAPTEKRLAPLRGFRGTALPGQALVVFDPEVGLVTDVVPCEDAYASERPLLATLFASAAPDDVWILDRNFATRPLVRAAETRRAKVVIREHASHPNAQPAGPRCHVGRIETGDVYEQRVTIPRTDDAADDDDGDVLTLRRIEIVLDTPTTDGATVVRLLTTLPARVRARTIARLYRKRWTIEAAFGRLEAALHAEVATLAYPRAALFAFGVALVAFNVLAVVETAIAAAHDLTAADGALSTYAVAGDVAADYHGMMIALDAAVWAAFAAATPADLAAQLRTIAGRVDLRALRKQPRGPKPKKPKRYVRRAAVTRHVATARVLLAGKVV